MWSPFLMRTMDFEKEICGCEACRGKSTHTGEGCEYESCPNNENKYTIDLQIM